MLILFLVITTLVELLAIFSAVQSIKREIKRLFDNVDSCYGSLFGALINIPSWKDIKPMLDGIADHLKKDEKEWFYNVAAINRAFSDIQTGVSQLLAREDVSELVKKLDARLENAPDVLDREDEAKHSRDIEEGIANLLQYQVGKGKES